MRATVCLACFDVFGGVCAACDFGKVPCLRTFSVFLSIPPHLSAAVTGRPKVSASVMPCIRAYARHPASHSLPLSPAASLAPTVRPSVPLLLRRDAELIGDGLV